MPDHNTVKAFSSPPTSRRWLLTLAVAGVLAVLPHTLTAAPQDTFAPFVGSWRGVGHISKKSGGAERLSCRATYATESSQASLSQSLVCASDSFKVNLTSYLVAEAGSVQGHWEESTRQAQGGIDGTLRGGVFEGSISGPGFNASVSIKSAGKKQLVSIRPSAGDVAAVDIALIRTGE